MTNDSPLYTDEFEITDSLIGDTDLITHAECVHRIADRVPEVKNLVDFVLQVDGTVATVRVNVTTGGAQEILELIFNAIAA